MDGGICRADAMTNHHLYPAPTQRYILRLAIANGGRYTSRHPEVLLKLRRMVRRGGLEELPNTLDGAAVFDVTEAGIRALKESETK